MRDTTSIEGTVLRYGPPKPGAVCNCSRLKGGWLFVRCGDNGHSWHCALNTGEEVEIEVEVSGRLVPYRPATFHEPSEGGYADDLVAVDADGHEIPLTDDEIDDFQQELFEAEQDRDEAAREAAAEARAEMRAERSWDD